MDSINYGRRIFSFGEGGTVLESSSVTERALQNEDEVAFTRRLSQKYKGQRGTIEVVFKRGRPDYAIITFS